jgi:hypothetical protein
MNPDLPLNCPDYIASHDDGGRTEVNERRSCSLKEHARCRNSLACRVQTKHGTDWSALENAIRVEGDLDKKAGGFRMGFGASRRECGVTDFHTRDANIAQTIRLKRNRFRDPALVVNVPEVNKPRANGVVAHDC